eukprot:GGOE01032043.1.p1 GENE.GGOE01032043.1~~GGOE01032043.1.p1  ORF type:complete len:869 (-),score=188.83 GGOE01032043.1:1500-3770(-)
MGPAVLPSWGQCAASSLAIAMVPPIIVVVMSGLAVGLFTSAGHPATRWYAVLYAGVSLAALGSLCLTFAWRLRRLLLQVAVHLPEATHAPDDQLADLLTNHDCCVQYALQALRCADGPADWNGETADPLDFVQEELEDLVHSTQGVVVIDTSGVILWTNLSLCWFFGYETTELLQENVHLLMPQPYAAQHDHFLRRHLRTGTCTVLGGSREVPVLRRDGSQCVVMLSVEERTDPDDTDRRLFLGRMDFDHQGSVIARIQARLKSDDGADLAALDVLDSSQDAMVAISARGTLLYCNVAAAHLFRWTPTELVGQNVTILMAEPFASAHDGFLCNYVERDEQCRRRGQPHVSNVVGSGRDVMAQDRMGQSVRIFLTVTRVDVRSGRAADCLFLGRMVRMDSASSTGTAQPPYEALGIEGPAAVQLGPRPQSMPIMTKHRCTVVVLRAANLESGLPSAGCRDLCPNFGPLLNLVDEIGSQHRGQLQCVMAGQAVIAFNTDGLPNSAHRASAAAFMLELSEAIAGSFRAKALGVRMVAVSQEAYSTRWEAQEVVAGDTVDLANALLRLQETTNVCKPVIDGALHDELRYSYTCRLVNRLVVHPDGPQDRVVEAFELLSQKEAAQDEWMYQLSAEEKTANASWAHWHEVWAHLPAPPTTARRPSGVAAPSQALAALQAHLALSPQDGPGQVLLAALRCAVQSSADKGRVEYCGALPFQLQFSIRRTSPPSSSSSSIAGGYDAWDALEMQRGVLRNCRGEAD